MENQLTIGNNFKFPTKFPKRELARLKWTNEQRVVKIEDVVFKYSTINYWCIFRRYRIQAFCNALWYWKGIRKKKFPEKNWLCRKYNKLIVSLANPPPTKMHFFLFLNALWSKFQWVGKKRILYQNWKRILTNVFNSVVRHGGTGIQQ